MAIERFCFVRLAAENLPLRRQLAGEIRAVLRAAGARATVGEPADNSAARWDVSIVVRCDDIAAWTKLAELPTVAALFASRLPSLAVVIKAWSFEVP